MPADQMQWTIGQVLDWMTQKFALLERTTPRLDAQLLLSRVLGLSRVALYTKLDQPLTLEERTELRSLVRRRVAGEPVAYILEEKNWHDMCLFVDNRVLIPRPETETLFDLTRAWLESRGEAPTVIVDLCTGSGCLALALARCFPDAQVYGVDNSKGALEVAQINASRLGVSNVEWIFGDVLADTLWQNLNDWHQDGLLLVVTNPPYVSEEEWKKCDVEVRQYEPREALVAADNGLEVARSVFENWKKHTESFAEHPNNTRSSCLCVEAGDGHPESLLVADGAERLVFHASGAARDYPSDQSFACQDLEGRPRFFMSARGSASLGDNQLALRD